MIWTAIGKYVIGAGVVLGLLTGVWFYGESKYQAGHKDCMAAQNLAALEQFKSEAENLAGLSELLHQQTADLAQAKPKIIERYTRVEVEKPLPAGCVLDAGRLQHINSAIREANTSGKPQISMSTSASARN